MNLVASAPSLILSPDNIGTTIPCHALEVSCPDESVKLSAAVDDSKLGSISTVSATANLLRRVRDSANAFTPLKSVAGHLCFILENSQVWPPSCTAFSPQCLLLFQQTEVDTQAMELLAPRIKLLSESLCAPIRQGDVNEQERGEKLKW